MFYISVLITLYFLYIVPVFMYYNISDGAMNIYFLNGGAINTINVLTTRCINWVGLPVLAALHAGQHALAWPSTTNGRALLG